MDVRNVIKNQEKIYNMLKNTIKEDRLSHAYLFYGEEGTGKKEMAYALSCLLYGDDDSFSNETSKNILNNNFINVTYIGVLEGKKMISKEQIEALQEDFSKTSLVEGIRIYIIDGIDTASLSAQNSLLKFIEDPQNKTKTLGIFIANEKSMVVSTIISRCILIPFLPIPEEKSIEMLRNDGLDELDSALVVNLTNNIDEAKNIIASENYKEVKELFLEFLSLETDKELVLFYINTLKVFQDSNNLVMLLKFILLFLQLVAHYKEDQSNLILTPLYDKIKTYSLKYSNKIEDKIELILELFDMLKYNVLAKNVFHELILKYLK